MKNTQTNPTVKLGRPVNTESNRQKRLAEIAERRALGLVKRGRPVVEGSKNAVIKAARYEKIMNGETLRKGRPVNNNSKRQQRINELAAKKASGTFKLGRPKMNVVIEVPTKAKVSKKVKVVAE
jgi:hypothetical protein